MTPEQIQAVITETERRFKMRTPAKSVLDGLPSYRVVRSEIVAFCRGLGFEPALPGTDDDYDRALYQLYDRLRLEFPGEKWEKIGTFSADRARRVAVGLPPCSNSQKRKATK